MLGVSAYLKDLDTVYLEKAAQIGVKYVFTSLHIPEEDFSNIDQQLPLLLTTCRQNNLMLVPDISPVTFEKLGLKNGDMGALKKLGINAVRLDYGFDDPKELVDLQANFTLFLNASVVNQQFMDDAIKAGLNLADIQMTHNFYPKADTGLTETLFRAVNTIFQEKELRILAFIPGDRLKRFPFYQGLPTLEKHRGVQPYVAAVELLKKFGVTDILVGDSFAQLATLEMIQKYMTAKIMTLPVKITEKANYNLYHQVIKVRRDIPGSLVRLSTPRLSNVPIQKTLNRSIGMITMENKLGGRYSGEINLCKVSLPFSASTNCIGFVHPEYVDLLQYIDAETSLELIPLDEK